MAGAFGMVLVRLGNWYIKVERYHRFPYDVFQIHLDTSLCQSQNKVSNVPKTLAINFDSAE